MKKTIITLINSIFLFITFLFSSQVFAACTDACNGCGSCPPRNIQPSTNLNQCINEGGDTSEDANAGGEACAQTQVIGTLRGDAQDASAPSNLRTSTEGYGVKTMKEDMRSHGTLLTETVDERKERIVKSYSKMMTSLTELIMSSTLNHTQMNTEIEESNLKAQMEYQSDLIATSTRENGSKVGTGTSEEVKFILNELKKANTEHTPVVIASMKAKYDNNEDFKIPVRYKHTEGVTTTSINCPEYDPENNGELADYSCYKAQDANPGKTLEVYFKECSLSKSREIAKMQEKASETVQTSETKKESKSNFNSLNSTQAVVNQQIVDGYVACTEEQILRGRCEVRDEYSSPDEYRANLIDDIIENKVIVNGSKSSLNLLTPPLVGSIDGDIDLTEEEYNVFLAKAGEVSNVAVSTNTPKLITTYKTSSQYIAAKGFANNITGESIISNIAPERRNDLNTATFVSGFKQRQAMLNLAKMSYAESIAARTGKKISEKIHKGELSYNDEVVKEDINGAAKMDTLRHQVEKNFEEVNKNKAPSGYGEGNMDLKAKIYETEVQKARVNLESYLHWNRIELILAAKLVDKVNLPINKEYINKLKNK